MLNWMITKRSGYFQGGSKANFFSIWRCASIDSVNSDCQILIDIVRGYVSKYLQELSQLRQELQQAKGISLRVTCVLSCLLHLLPFRSQLPFANLFKRFHASLFTLYIPIYSLCCVFMLCFDMFFMFCFPSRQGLIVSKAKLLKHRSKKPREPFSPLDCKDMRTHNTPKCVWFCHFLQLIWVKNNRCCTCLHFSPTSKEKGVDSILQLWFQRQPMTLPNGEDRWKSSSWRNSRCLVWRDPRQPRHDVSHVSRHVSRSQDVFVMRAVAFLSSWIQPATKDFKAADERNWHNLREDAVQRHTGSI